MEEQEDVQESGVMEKVEAQQLQQDELVNSSAPDESNSKLLRKDREILLGLLPADCWLDVINMLLDGHCNDDLKNLCNASSFFRELILSKSVLFLFPEVLKIVGPQLENEEGEQTSGEEKSSLLTCRSVCKSWNKSVDHYINASLKPDFFQAPPTLPNVPKDPVMRATKYKYFGFMAPQRLQKFLDYFTQSHQLDVGPQRNPFIGTTVALCNDLDTAINRHFGANVLTLLRKYGQHIRVMCLGLSTSSNERLPDYLWLKELLECTPNLTHLKVKQGPGCIEMDPYFGEHAYRTVATEEYLRRRIISEMSVLPAEVTQQIVTQTLQIHQQVLSMDQVKDIRHLQNYDVDEHLAECAREIGREAGLWPIIRQEREQRRLQEKNAPPAPPRLNANELSDVVAGDPLPVFKNLECLKLCKLYARVFNPLIQSNRQVSWLHIEPFMPDHWLESYVDWWTFDFPNLRKLYIKFSGGPEEVRRLRNFHPSFMKLTSLHFEYYYPSNREEYMGWAEIFQIIEQNWADTLIELKIHLPEPKSDEDKEDAKNACERGRLALPKLKRLVIWMRNPSCNWNYMYNLQFLNSIRENLEEFVVM